MTEVSARTRQARELFAPLGPTYDRYANVLSFGQDPRWRRFLVSRVPDDALRVLDVASGTAAVAIELARAVPGRSIVGVDQSAEMLAAGRARVERAGLGSQVELREGRAESLPFEGGEFDALTFTYLLRYVDDPGATSDGFSGRASAVSTTRIRSILCSRSGATPACTTCARAG